ncbi:MAG: preprotein translocase subunit YajC [Treponema sp.]|nr:preprotein translocase subunit YajC [Treponema sp.]
MNSVVFYLLQANGEQAPSGPLGGFMTFLPFIAIIAIFYFLIIRPQNKKQKETQKMLSTLKKGDRIVTIGGINGTIQTVRDQTVIVKVDEDTKIEFNRSAIASIVVAAKEDKHTIDSSEDESEDK